MNDGENAFSEEAKASIPDGLPREGPSKPKDALEEFAEAIHEKVNQTQAQARYTGMLNTFLKDFSQFAGLQALRLTIHLAIAPELRKQAVDDFVKSYVGMQKKNITGNAKAHYEKQAQAQAQGIGGLAATLLGLDRDIEGEVSSALKAVDEAGEIVRKILLTSPTEEPDYGNFGGTSDGN